MKKKPDVEKENSERWLLTYSDMITLLMLFFIVMYAMSSVDKVKYQTLSESLASAFVTTADQSSGVGPGAGKIITDKASKIPEVPIQSRKAHSELYDKAYDILKSAIQSKQIILHQEERGIVVQLGAELFFPAGSADLPPNIMKTFIPVAGLLNYLPNNMQIEGYADDVPPEGNSHFRNNWELSSKRALNVLEALQDFGADPSRMSAVAYGDTHPVVSNATPEGRAYNNQVSVVLLYAPNSSSH
jgi:chemotaxis protein MotB